MINFALCYFFSLAALFFLLTAFQYRHLVKTYGMRDCVRDWIEKRGKLYYTLFIWFLDLVGLCWLIIFFSQKS